MRPINKQMRLNYVTFVMNNGLIDLEMEWLWFSVLCL